MQQQINDILKSTIAKEVSIETVPIYNTQIEYSKETRPLNESDIAYITNNKFTHNSVFGKHIITVDKFNYRTTYVINKF